GGIGHPCSVGAMTAAGTTRSPLLLFAALAAVSAFLCYLSITLARETLAFSFVSSDKVTIIPGLIFGTVVAACSRWFETRSVLQLALIIALTTVGWIAAVDAAMMTIDPVSDYQKAIFGPLPFLENDDGDSRIAPYMGGLAGGAVGGAFTILGLSIGGQSIRRLGAWAWAWGNATLAGAAVGLLAFRYDRSYLVLFLVWQIAVIIAIVRGLSAHNAQPFGWQEQESTG